MVHIRILFLKTKEEGRGRGEGGGTEGREGGGDGVRKEKVLVSSGLSEIAVVCEALLRFPCVNH